MSNLAWWRRAILAAALLAGGSAAGADSPSSQAATFVDQGRAWTAAKRSSFYTLDQGSRILPLAWFKALRRSDGSPFDADSLQRFGFLPNPGDPRALPVGFMAVGERGAEILGMNCAACHTRQITVAGTSYRVDGGPALTDFWGLLEELNASVGRLTTDSGALADFAEAVLGPNASPDARAELARDVKGWHERFNAWVSGSKPSVTWGVGRLDAVAMILNRVGGLGLGSSESRVIAENIVPADAPVRYPFLWNASRQERTQWLGFAENHNDLLRFLRNAGQVLGVFAEFRPVREPRSGAINYTSSLHVSGLIALENLAGAIGPPRFPGPIDPQLKRAGKEIYAQECRHCHGIRPSRSNPASWSTPVIPAAEIGTDSRQLDLYKRTSRTGVLAGSQIPLSPGSIQPTEDSLDLLRYAVLGASFSAPFNRRMVAETLGDPEEQLAALRNVYQAAPVVGYEARVLQGIWAAAPYLHNGSVPTLADLLKKPAERPPAFKVGPAYDLEKVGLSSEQPTSAFVLTTTDCPEPASGNSRCGHAYGVHRSETEKAALLEYLKSL